MVVGTCRISIEIPGSYSLKDKRRVVSSLLERIRHRFPVSAMEVADHDVWNRATLGAAIVSTSTAHAETVLNGIIHFVDEGGHADAALLDASIETITGL